MFATCCCGEAEPVARPGLAWLAALLGFLAVLLGSIAEVSAQPCLKSNLLDLYGACSKTKDRQARPPAQPAAIGSRLVRPAGKWRIHHVLLPRGGGEQAVVLELAAAGSGPEPRLVLRCMNAETNVMLQFPGRTMSDVREKSEILYRLDDGTESILELSLAPDPSVMGVWQGFRAVPFITRLMDAAELSLTAWDSNGARIDVVFETDGLRQAVVPLREGCGW